MAQKWYQKATVQAAIAGGVFIILAALISGFFGLANRPSAQEWRIPVTARGAKRNWRRASATTSTDAFGSI